MLLLLNVVTLFIHSTYSLVLLTVDHDNVNWSIMSYLYGLVIICLFLDMLFIYSINVKKFNDQKHLRMLENGYESAIFKLDKTIKILENDIIREIRDSVVNDVLHDDLNESSSSNNSVEPKKD